jgi:hypothetical protein
LKQALLKTNTVCSSCSVEETVSEFKNMGPCPCPLLETGLVENKDSLIVQDDPILREPNLKP